MVSDGQSRREEKTKNRMGRKVRVGVRTSVIVGLNEKEGEDMERLSARRRATGIKI